MALQYGLKDLPCSAEWINVHYKYSRGLVWTTMEPLHCYAYLYKCAHQKQIKACLFSICMVTKQAFHYIMKIFTVEPVYYGHIGTSQKCLDYQGVLIFQVNLHDNVSFGTTARCVDYAGVHIFKCPD